MAPESIKEETAKQASTADQMNKVEAEYSEEHKVEEEDDGGSDDGGIDDGDSDDGDIDDGDSDDGDIDDGGSDDGDSDDGDIDDGDSDDGGSDFNRRYNYMSGPAPEWDMDSYDGREYESDPELHELFSDEEDYQNYCSRMRQAIAGKGFNHEPLSNMYARNLDEISDLNMTGRELLTNLANICVKKLNDEKGTTVEFAEIVRAIVKAGPRWNSYITFMAREYPDGPLVEYQSHEGPTKFPYFLQTKS